MLTINRDRTNIYTWAADAAHLPGGTGNEENKMKTITANIPARTVTGKDGKKFSYAARTATFTALDDTGTLWIDDYDNNLYEADVIDICRKASNWSEIKAAHFAMSGFAL